jgi:hypothetical protein
MTDIVERLRASANGERELIAFEVREAADEIERWRDLHAGLRAEVARLRAALGMKP